MTTATAAVHLMQVPSARLLEAFVAMHRALERQDEERNPFDLPDPRGALAEVLLGALGGEEDAAFLRPQRGKRLVGQ